MTMANTKSQSSRWLPVLGSLISIPASFLREPRRDQSGGQSLGTPRGLRAANTERHSVL
jgi:hypothetical protein